MCCLEVNVAPRDSWKCVRQLDDLQKERQKTLTVQRTSDKTPSQQLE